MAAAEPTSGRMAKLRHDCQSEIQAFRERSAAAASSIRRLIDCIKPLADNTLADRGNLAKLKDHLKQLEARFCDILKVNASKEFKCKAIAEAISAMVVRIQHLKDTVQDQKAKKDEYEAVLSQQLLALQKFEEKNEEDVNACQKNHEVTEWYKRVLGFQIEGGEGVKFVFDKIDPKNSEKRYSLVIRLDGDIYTLLHCNIQLDDTEELVEELNRTNSLFKFVRIMREKFQETACNDSDLHSIAVSSPDSDSHSIAISSPPSNSIDSQSNTLLSKGGSSSQPRKRLLRSHQKVTPAKAAILSPQSVSNIRRSRRLTGRKL